MYRSIKSYFTTQYFKSFFYIFTIHNGPCLTIHVIKLLCHLGSKIISFYNETAFEYKFHMHSNENTTAYFKTFQWKHNSIVHLHKKAVFRCSFLCFNKICISPWNWIVKFFNDVWCVSNIRFIPFLHSIWLPISFIIIFQIYSTGFMSREFPGHSRMGILLHSRNV